VIPDGLLLLPEYLGLAISKALVEMHGGKIWLASKVGRGSIFSFTLPAKQPFKFEASIKQ